MYVLALATDYDGTIAHDGEVDPDTAAALKRLADSGRHLLLVTGRELPDLERVCPYLDLFERVVAENGALLYTPSSKTSKVLSPAPPQNFVDRLRSLNVSPLSVGQSIVATWEPNETLVLEVIRELGLDLQIIFNKGAVMVLPNGTNKASGLAAALFDMGLSPHNVVAVGDAENDLAFMRACGCAVAVSNALPAVKSACDLVTKEARGRGVAELIDQIVASEDVVVEASRERNAIVVGKSVSGEVRTVGPGDGAILIVGSSGGGKTTLATALLERFSDKGLQLCICDPEGDYAGLEGAIVFGDAKTPTRVEAIVGALEKPGANVVVNMLGTNLEDRPKLFHAMFPALTTLRARTGRPHWTLVDEAHHLLPRDNAAEVIPPGGDLPVLFVTVHPEAMVDQALARVGMVLAIGGKAQEAVRRFSNLTGRSAPSMPAAPLEQGEVLYWACSHEDHAELLICEKPRQAQKRHTRKYAEGTLGEDRSFYFRGPEGKLNLRAQNLGMFLQLADGVDDGTFKHHLEAGDYSRWITDAIKDGELAAEVRAVEEGSQGNIEEARQQIRQAVEARYTAPAEAG